MCVKLRRKQLYTKHIQIFIKTQQFAYNCIDIALPIASNADHQIVDYIKSAFIELYKNGVEYRATGVVCTDLVNIDYIQYDLFGQQKKSDRYQVLYKTIDTLNQRFGSGCVVLAASLPTTKTVTQMSVDNKKNTLFQSDAFSFFWIPYYGSVC